MKKDKNKVVLYMVLGIVTLLIVVLTVTYAYWRLTKEQTNRNVINTGCFNISFTGENDINIPKAYPISDDDGLKLQPYTFKIKNNCETKADYQINLEMLTDTNLSSDYVRITLNEKGVDGTPSYLSSFDNYDDLKLENTIEGRKLFTGTLEGQQEKNYELRIWLGSNATIENETMNKTYKSKIVVETTFKGEEPEESKTLELGTDILPVENGDGLYAVTHDVSEISTDWNQTEYRYAGTNPNNYVKFNNEIWRIIGLVNVKVGNSVEQRVKIVRTDGISSQKNLGYYFWDTSKNNWTTAKLKDMLNGIYYESGTGNCYTTSTKVKQCDFNTGTDLPKGLDDTARSMIDKEVIWNIGGSSTDEDVTVKMFYERERGTSTGSSNANPSEWSSETDVGEKHNGIGLIYPSDYGYATNGGSIGRKTCFEEILYNWKKENYVSECAGKDWLKLNGDYWTLSSHSTGSLYVFFVHSFGDITREYIADRACGVWPVVYLSSSVKITSNPHSEQEYGTIDNPFILTE